MKYNRDEGICCSPLDDAVFVNAFYENSSTVLIITADIVQFEMSDLTSYESIAHTHLTNKMTEAKKNDGNEKKRFK